MYTSYFDKFPKIEYDINRSQYPVYDLATNIFFRLGMLQSVLNNTSSYYVLELEDGETPEILADKVYGDAGAGWIILFTNRIIDPQFDWPLNYDAFEKYVIEKYGSIEIAKTTYHHYEKVVIREVDGITTTNRYVINKERLIENDLSVPYNYFEPYAISSSQTADSTALKADNVDIFITADADLDSGETAWQGGSLAYTQYVNTYNFEGKTIVETVRGEAISNYDYENALNESRREIKVIKKEYYNQIIYEFNALTNYSESFVRRLV